ncbi:MAG: SWIM zinc finger family protein [Nitrospira sp.]
MVKVKFTYKIQEDENIPNVTRWSVTKLDADLEAHEVYFITQDKFSEEDPRFICTCPSYKRPCKHVGMVKMYKHRKKSTPQALCAYFNPAVNEMKLVQRQ